MDARIRRSVTAGPGKSNIDGLKQAMHSVRTLPTGLYGITSEEFGQTHVQSAGIFLECGAKMVQYRGKGRDGSSKPAEEMVKECLEIKEMCLKRGALLIVDDSVDVAVAVNAHGVHLGQDDMPVREARKLFDGIIGVSAKTPEQARAAELAGATYIGCGAVFPTKTKQGALEIGLGGLAAVVSSVSIPVYAIGGIRLENLQAVKKVGPYGVAVISGVLAAPDPVLAGSSIIKKWNEPDISHLGIIR